jgi:hypothetical protein
MGAVRRRLRNHVHINAARGEAIKDFRNEPYVRGESLSEMSVTSSETVIRSIVFKSMHHTFLYCSRTRSFIV